MASQTDLQKGDDSNNSVNGGDDGMDAAPPIRVDCLFMNQHLQKFLGFRKNKPFNPQERLDMKRVVPYQFQTKQTMEKRRVTDT